MNFGGIFGNSVLIFFFICLGIFMHSQMTAEQKLVVLYLSCYVAGYIGAFRRIYNILIVVLIQIIYSEFISDDIKKMEIIKSFRLKMLDYLYQFIFIYMTWLYVLSIFLLSYKFGIMIGEGNVWIAKCTSALVMGILIQKICSPKFQTISISKIMDTFMQYPPYKFPHDVPIEKFCVLTDIEDKSYFARKHTYNVLSLEFVKYKMGKFSTHSFKSLYDIKKLIKKVGIFIKRSKNIRGYSTIEMQLLRTIAVSGGYAYTFQRKIYEFFYTKIFLTSLREYYRYHTAGNDANFKTYLIWVYYNVVPVKIWGNRYVAIKDVFNCSVDKWTLEQLFVVILALSGRRVHDETLETYAWVIDKYQLNVDEIIGYAQNGFRDLQYEYIFSFICVDGDDRYYFDEKELSRLLDEYKEMDWKITVNRREDEYQIRLTMKKPIHILNVDEYIREVEMKADGAFTHEFG